MDDGPGTTAAPGAGLARHPAKKGRLRCHKRPKSREETPKEGIGGNNVAALQQYIHASNKNQEGDANIFKFYQSYNGLFLKG